MPTWKFDPNKSFEENYQAKIEAEKIDRQNRGLDPNGLSPEWLATVKDEISQQMLQGQSEKMLNPNSDYYKSIGKQIRNQLTGAMSPNSLLALTVAMGGSPSQAKEQIKATEGRINESASNLTNQYYLNASGQGTSLLSTIAQMNQQNSQFQTNLRAQNDMYGQQKSDSFLNQGLSLLGGIAGTLIAPGIGTMVGSQLGSSLSGGGNTQMGSNTYNSDWINQQMNSYFRKK